MIKKRYLEGLEGWRGYPKSELYNGKYRPVFSSGRNRVFFTAPQPNLASEWYRKLNKGIVRVPATKENIKKFIAFNKKYGSEGYRQKAIKLQKMLRRKITMPRRRVRVRRAKRRYAHVIKAVVKQTGRTTIARDRKRTAMKPGKRRSASGKTYWETRRNRSDRSRRLRL